MQWLEHTQEADAALDTEFQPRQQQQQLGGRAFKFTACIPSVQQHKDTPAIM